MAGTIKSTLKNCSETFATSYSTAGTPFTTNTIFTKTISSDSGFVFVTPPTIDFSGTSNKNSYSFTVVDNPVDGVKNKNLTSRAFTVNYTYGLTQPTNDLVKFFASATRSHTATTTNIYGYDIDTSSIKQGGENRTLLVYGDPGVSLSIQVKKTGGSNLNSTTSIVKTTTSNSTTVQLTTANSKIFVGMSVTGTNVGSNVTVAAISGKTLTLSAAKSLAADTVLTIGASGSFTATLDNSGKFTLPIFFPRVSSATNYTITLTEIASGSFSSNLSTPTNIIIYQYINTTFTLNTSQVGTDFIVSGNNISETALGNSVKSVKTNFTFYVTSNIAGVNHDGAASIIPIKTAQDAAANYFTTSMLTGVSELGNAGLILTNDADVVVSELQVVLGQGTTRTTAGSTNTKAVTLSSANAAIKIGMKVTGSGISNVVTVASIDGTSLVLSSAPGGTISNGTTLTFNSVGTLTGDLVINKFGSSNDTLTIPVNSVLKLNEPPTSAGIANQQINTNSTVNITLPAASDPESNSTRHIITQLPQKTSNNASNGSLKYVNAGETTTITSVPHVLPVDINRVVGYTRAADSTDQTDFKFKVNDGFRDSVEYTVLMNLS